MTKQETIEEARRLYKEGAFNRLVKARVADNIHFDEATLECGHKALMMHREKSSITTCTECADEWLKSNTTT